MHCTYVTQHPTGFRYFGKSQVHLIHKGYQGSGVRLQCAFMEPGFERHTWSTTIIQEFESEAEAYAHEAELCPLSKLTSPWCMNDVPGGKFMARGSAHWRIVRSAKSKERKAALAERKAKAKMVAAKKKEAHTLKLLKKRQDARKAPQTKTSTRTPVGVASRC